jgi:hypothetical protein
MTKTVIALILIILAGSLSGQEPAFRLSVTTGGYLPEYPDYDYNSPLYGVDIQMDLMNIIDNYGIGAECFLDYTSFHDYFKEMNTYEVYLHNISGYFDSESKFGYGVFAGARRTELYYEDRKMGYNVDTKFTRFVGGFKYISNNWGGIIRWTQNESRKSKLEYELKLNNSSGWVIQAGGSLQGPIKGAKSDFHIYAGYEFYL